MTVGVPEISLDTWGLKYVKKGAKPSETISANSRISDADVKTPDAFETRRETADSGAKRTSGATQGSDKRTTLGADRKERNQQYDIPATSKLTQSGTSASKNPQNPKGVASGATASHESGIQSVETRTGKDRVGVPVDPERKGKPTHSALPKAKAEMELAIIKCKLLKMNDISKKGEWDHLPHAQKEKEEEEKETKKGFGGTEQEQSPKADDGTPQGAKVSDKEIKDKKLDHVYRSEDVVEKAIELINEAYDEMKSTDFRKLKPTYEGDTKETKKAKDDYCRHCGSKKEHLDSEGKQIPEGDEEEHYDHVDTSSKGHANREGFSKETKKYTKEEKDRIEHVTTGEDFDPPTPQKGEHKWVAGNDPHGKPDEYCKTCGKTRTDKDKEAPTSTGDVGAANFVYSDVKEAKKQDKEGKKDKKRFTSEEEEKKRSDKEFLERNRDVQLERND